MKAVAEALRDGTMAHRIIDMHRVYVKSVLKFKPGERGVVTNGRVLGPFDQEETFVVDDFALLDRLCYNNFGQKILQVFGKDKEKGNLEKHYFFQFMACHFLITSLILIGENSITYLTSDTVMQMTSILASRADLKVRFKIPIKASDQVLSMISLLPQNPSLPSFDIVAVVDPVSKGAQKIGPILSVLHQAVNSHLRVYLNCVEKNSDLPLKR